jgi:hypothetical protein
MGIINPRRAEIFALPALGRIAQSSLSIQPAIAPLPP